MDHLKRVKPCPCHFSNQPREDIIKSLSSRTYDCLHCNRAFAGLKWLTKHQDDCNMKEKLNIMQKTIESMAIKIESLQQNTNVVNNTMINNFNITINNFGSEDRSYVTRELVQQCLEKMKIDALVDAIYFNPDRPENQTIKLKSEKRMRVVVHQEGKWVERDMNASIDTIINRENSSISSHFYDNIWPDQTIDFENKAFQHGKLIKINDKNKAYFEQRRSIQARLKNDVNVSNYALTN